MSTTISRQRRHQKRTGYHNTGRIKSRLHLYKVCFKTLCQRCLTEKSKVLHHIDGDNKNDIIENLISLCQKCHVKTHVEMPGKKRTKLKIHKKTIGTYKCLICFNGFEIEQFELDKKMCIKCNLNKVALEKVFNLLCYQRLVQSSIVDRYPVPHLADRARLNDVS